LIPGALTGITISSIKKMNMLIENSHKHLEDDLEDDLIINFSKFYNIKLMKRRKKDWHVNTRQWVYFCVACLADEVNLKVI